MYPSVYGDVSSLAHSPDISSTLKCNVKLFIYFIIKNEKHYKMAPI